MAPVADRDLMELIKETSTGMGSATPLLKAYNRGWTEEHLKITEIEMSSYARVGSLRDAVVKLAHEVPEMRKHLVPLLQKTAMEFDSKEEMEEYRRTHKVRPTTHLTVKKQEGGKPQAEAPKPEQKSPAKRVTPEDTDEWTPEDHDKHYKDSDYKTGTTKGYYPLKEPPGLKEAPEMKEVPENIKKWMGMVTVKDLEKNESYNHPGLKKVQKELEKMTADEVKDVYNKTWVSGIRGKFHDKMMEAKTDEDADMYRFPMRRLYHVWQAANAALSSGKLKK